MNDESDLILNTHHLADGAETILRLNSQDGSGDSFVENLQSTSELIINESNNYTNQNEAEKSVNQYQEDEAASEVSKINEEPDLPSTTILLQTTWGSKVYVVGTSHFSVQSQEDVAKVITAVQPNSVVLELCPSRSYMLAWNEEQMEMVKNLDYKIMKEAINTYGVFQGIVQLLLLSMSFQITREMGMAPGGEFRRAFRESLNIPGCVVFLGDRPIEITLRRAFASMSWWQAFKFAYCVIFCKAEFNKDEIEKFKNRDYLGNMLEMFGGEFPELKEVFVNERDLYLTYSLENAAMITPKDIGPKTTEWFIFWDDRALHHHLSEDFSSLEKFNVVGVVGIGHLAGIQRNWELGKVDISDVQRVSKIPLQTRTSKVLRFTLKVSFYSLAFYGFYKLASRARFYLPSIPLFR